MQTKPVQAVVGWPHGGLSEKCLEQYVRLVTEGVPAEQIVVLVSGRVQVEAVQEQLALALPVRSGPLLVETFLGFALRMLAEFWAEVRTAQPQLPATFEPVVLDRGLVHYAYARACALCPHHAARFEACGLPEERQWEQLASAAWSAAAAGIGVEKIGSLLAAAWPVPEDSTRLAQLEATTCCALQARQFMLANGALDAGLALELFVDQILPLAAFWDSFAYLIVDRFDESSAVAVDFVRACLDRHKGVFVAYTVGGAALYTAASGAAAALVFQRLPFTYLSAPEANLRHLADRIARQIYPPFKNPLPLPEKTHQPVLVEGQTTVEAAVATAEQIRGLLAAGVRPERIAVIVPVPDAALAHLLAGSLDQPLAVLRPTTALVQRPAVRALLSAIELAHPQWGLFPSFAEARLLFEWLFQLDPIRAELLVTDVLDPVGRSLRGSEAVRFPERVGFERLAQLQQLVDWLFAYQEGATLPVDRFLERFAADLLAEVLAEPTNAQVFADLREAVQRARLALGNLPGHHLLALLRSGHTPQQPETVCPGRVVLATPLAFINRGLATDYQFWFDITSERWSRSSWLGLYNWRVLATDWDGQPFDAARDLHDRRQRLARMLFNLCCRTSQGLFLVRSTLSSRGELNTSRLDQLILAAAAEPG